MDNIIKTFEIFKAELQAAHDFEYNIIIVEMLSTLMDVVEYTLDELRENTDHE